MGAWLGGVFLAGAAAAAWCGRRGRRGGLIGCVAAVGIVFTGAMAFWGVGPGGPLQGAAPRWCRRCRKTTLRREVRVAALDYFQPSLVFYCQREVQCPENIVRAIEFLHTPLPVYLFVCAGEMGAIRVFAPASYHLVARHRDLYNGREVLLMTNEPLN